MGQGGYQLIECKIYDINGILCEIQGKEYVTRFYKFMKCGFRFLGCSRNFLARFFSCFLVINQLCGFVLSN